MSTCLCNTQCFRIYPIHASEHYIKNTNNLFTRNPITLHARYRYPVTAHISHEKMPKIVKQQVEYH